MTMLLTITKNAAAFICAVLCAYIVGTLFVTQININTITELGIAVSFSQRISAAVNDLINMLSLYGSLIAGALFIGLLFTRLILVRFIQPTTKLYALAGFVALLVLHGALYMAFDISAIAATRSVIGLLSQALAGAIGGMIFIVIRRRFKD